jgi:hypothetical protein
MLVLSAHNDLTRWMVSFSMTTIQAYMYSASMGGIACGHSLAAAVPSLVSQLQ